MNCPIPLGGVRLEIRQITGLGPRIVRGQLCYPTGPGELPHSLDGPPLPFPDERNELGSSRRIQAICLDQQGESPSMVERWPTNEFRICRPVQRYESPRGIRQIPRPPPGCSPVPVDDRGDRSIGGRSG
jgi:hypothetical protein